MWHQIMTSELGVQGSEDAIEILDGRRRRAVESRRRIIAAMMALIEKGDAHPTAEDVAELAGVGLRTVFRLFDDMDSIHREISATMRAAIMPLVRQPFLGASAQERLQELVDRRATICERLLPFRMASDIHRVRSEFLRSEYAATLEIQREMVTLALGPGLASDRELLEAVDLALSFESWRRLRIDQSLSIPDARAVMRRLAKALVP